MSITSAAVKRLLQIYMDELIVVHLKNMNVATTTEDGQDLNISPMVDGYVIDIDQDFFYLGSPDGTINKTIAHDSIGVIEIAVTTENILEHLEMTNDGDAH